MKEENGKTLLPVWVDHVRGGFRYFIAAKNKKEVCFIMGCNPENVERVKGVYATGKPREL